MNQSFGKNRLSDSNDSFIKKVYLSQPPSITIQPENLLTVCLGHTNTDKLSETAKNPSAVEQNIGTLGMPNQI